MRFLYATVLSLAVGLVGHSLQAQPAGNNRPQVPETFVKELAEGLKELALAVKAIPTSIHIETSWTLGNNAVLGIGIASFSAVLCVLVVSGTVLAGIPRRQA